MEHSLLEKLGWKDYLGSETKTIVGEPVIARDIRRYALAIDDPNPIYYDEEIAKNGRYKGFAAPPFYITWAAGVPKSETRVKDLGEDGLASFVGIPEVPNVWELGWVRGGEEIEFFRPVYVGDTVSVKGKFVDVTEKEGKAGPMVFATSEFEYINQNGEILARHRITMIAMPRRQEED
ncbi:MAG: MaoC family dehydratase N-terminal domain-containing protein [Fischerella sp.]|nr:MaoC family dehydratase N-terminal domain-containing protein [Fischerella sp.]